MKPMLDHRSHFDHGFKPQNAVEAALSRVRKITGAAPAASPHRHNGDDMRAQTDAPDRIADRGGDMRTRTHPNRSA